MRDFIDKTSEQAGTPINRDYLMALQGFEAQTIVAGEDENTFVATNSLGETLTTTFVDGENENESKIIQVFSGKKTITKTTSFKNGILSEVIL